MPSAVVSHSPSGLWAWARYHFFSDPGPWNDQCPCVNLRVYSVTLWAFAQQFSLFHQCRCTSTWRWSFLGNAWDHTLIHSSSFESRREFPMKWVLGRFPLELHRLPVDSIQIFVFPKTNWSCLPILGLVRYWYLPDTALGQKRRWLSVANGTALSVNREVSLHIGCCKYSWWSQIFCVSFTRMNCILKSDRHKYTPYRCVHIEVFHLIRQTSTISLSHNREEFVQVQHGICVVAFGSRISRFSWSDQFPRTYWIFKKIQVFLVFFCRDKFPCTNVQNCNFLPSLRTRRCILIVYSHVKFPCTWTICSTGCFEYPRAFRRNQTTCRDKWDQARRKLWFCHDPVVSFLFLHPFRLMSARSVCAVSRSVIRSVLRSQPIPQPTRWISRLPQATC